MPGPVHYHGERAALRRQRSGEFHQPAAIHGARDCVAATGSPGQAGATALDCLVAAGSIPTSHVGRVPDQPAVRKPHGSRARLAQDQLASDSLRRVARQAANG